MTAEDVRIGAWVLLFAVLGMAAAAWFTPTPHLEADDARTLVVDALAAADVEVDEVGPARRGEHRTNDGDTVAVWNVFADVAVGDRDEQIELRVQRSAGQLVYVDDRIGDDDTERLLTDDQFAVLGAHRDSALADRWVLRNGFAAVSAVITAATCWILTRRSETLMRQP